MAVNSVLRINMTGMCESPKDEAKRYQTALDMATFAEQHGFKTIAVEEHHCAGNGWLPSPITMAAMIIARTQKVMVNVSALLVTLYDPLRLAEDIAILDLVSNGRFNFVAGLGYRPIEYHAMDKSWEDRGQLMDDVIEALLNAWTGEPFEYKGKTVRITPVPVTKPHPFFFIGGMSKTAARRAAKFGVPFYPPQHMPELEELYHAELARHGHKGFVYYPTEDQNSMLFLDENPDQAWEELAPYFLRETQEYASWKVDGVPRPSEQTTNTIDDLKAQQRYVILSPEECLERINSRAMNCTNVLHPLVGGMPLDRAWRSLELYVEKVLPAVSPKKNI